MKRQVPAGGIVVGTDGSAHAESAVRWAARQAAAEGRPLDLVHAIGHVGVGELAWLATPGLNLGDLATALHESADNVLADARRIAEATRPGIVVRAHVIESDARDALIEASRSAHLLVLGSRGRGPWKRLVLGSVSSAVTREAACPVVVLRPTSHVSNHPCVLVGADGTDASLPVIEFAFEQASIRHLPLVVMHCFFDAVLAVQGDAEPLPASTDPDDLRLLLAETVAGMREKYPDVEVDLQLAAGLVDRALLDHAPEADLVVVGRCDLTGWSRFLYSSVALAVLERAESTVAVVPENSRNSGERNPLPERNPS